MGSLFRLAGRPLAAGMNGGGEAPPLSAPGGSGGGGDGERLARFEANLERVATREDLAKGKALIERKEPSALRCLLLSLATLDTVAAMSFPWLGMETGR